MKLQHGRETPPWVCVWCRSYRWLCYCIVRQETGLAFVAKLLGGLQVRKMPEQKYSRGRISWSK